MKLATPLATVTVVAPALVQVRVPADGLVPMARVTDVVLSVVTTLPNLSPPPRSRLAKEAPEAEEAGGWVVTASLDAGPAALTTVLPEVPVMVPGVGVGGGHRLGTGGVVVKLNVRVPLSSP